MTAPRVAIAETSLPRVREYLDRVVSDAIREAAEAVRLVDQIRAHLAETERVANGHLRHSHPAGVCCAQANARLRLAQEVRALLDGEVVADDTWRCAWCQQPVTSLPCTNPDCPGTQGRR